MKNQYDDINLYTPLTVHVVSINFDGRFRQNASLCGTILAIKDHFNNI